MPLSKLKKKKLEQASRLNAAKKRRINSLEMTDGPTPLPVSPDSTMKEQKGNSTLTNKNSSTMQKELSLLNKKERQYPCLPQDSGNRLVHWDSLKEMFSDNLVCRHCGSDVYINETTVGIATQVGLICKNRNCKLHQKSFVRKTIDKKIRNNSNAAFAINCQFVLALMQIGGGASEAGLMLSYLNLPHSSTFQNCTYYKVQEAIRPAIIELSEKSMVKVRQDEVLATVGEDKSNLWKQKKIEPSHVPLTISYDMGWNKRSSGTKYDSISGHGFVLGSRTKKILQFKVLSKSCSKCSIAAAKNKVVKPHACPKNHDGSSKSMETEAIFRMVKEAYDDLGYSIATIILDDDSTTKANLRHSWKEKVKQGKMKGSDWPKTISGVKKKDNGRLPLHIPEPQFLADFNHRVKVVGKSVYNLAKMPQKQSMVTKAMAERIKTNSGAMLRQIRHLKCKEDETKIKKGC